MISFFLQDILSTLQARLIGDNLDFTGASIDTRSIQTGNLFIALRGDQFDGHDFIQQAEANGAIALLVDCEVQTTLPQVIVKDTALALQQLAGLWRDLHDLIVIAITGSNGKTTVKDMLTTLLQAKVGEQAVLATKGNFNNEIGVPLTLFGLSKQHRYAVIEMGANHAGEIARLSALAKPNIAVITLCAPAHLAGFKSERGVAEAKGEIFASLQDMPIAATAVINADDQYADYWRGLNPSDRQISRFGLQSDAAVYADDINLEPEYSEFCLRTAEGYQTVSLPLAGQHNIYNALAACGCALAAGCELEQIAQALANCQTPPGRLQRHQLSPNISLWDDSYNANPSSVRAAIQVLAQSPAPRWLVLGDLGELGEDSVSWHQGLGEAARQAGLERVLTLGKDSAHTSRAFGEQGLHFEQLDALTDWMQHNLQDRLHILVKGSRAARMERVVQALQQQQGSQQ